ncbi:SDR family NAD(P)-dependent oxidoreductase [Agromyces silvae]|uniref:SDR family NAD(P)-dependent oxidoreductase n=1 Tax=Agromyces silvae TaxID=3388266 RepID=UPI00280A57A3|nr:SDR family oxidoreductase [Agromyces protaetiae]
MFDFTGLRALVTGATSGIGAAIASALEERGAVVLRHGLEGADPGLDLDLGVPDAARRLAERALAGGPVDVVVLSASLQIRSPWRELSADDFDRQLRVNLTSGVELLKGLVPGMQERGFGRIVAIGSVQQVRPHPDMIAYAASKAALANVTQNLARQLAPAGITVNALSPGVVRTPRNTEALADEAYLKTVLGGIPAGRIGDPADCVAAALLLCSREAGYITGQDITIDGGMTL